MKTYYYNKRGSILVISLILFSVLIIVALAFIGQEMISSKMAIRSQVASTQEEALEITLQRFADVFSKKPEGKIKLIIPERAQDPGKPQYDMEFKSAPQRNKKFEISGNWKQGQSIYYPPEEFPGKDYDTVSQGGYYEQVASPGYNNTRVPPWCNLLTLATPLKASYNNVFCYHFPFGAYAPEGKIKLLDSYGCSNDIDDQHKHEDYFSSVPVEIFAHDDIEIQDFPFGKAYSQEGIITIREKRGAAAFTGLSTNRGKEFAAYSEILQKQVNDSFDTIKKVGFDRSGVFFGKPITSIKNLCELHDNMFTLEQSTSFPFAIMTSFEEHPEEKEIGCYYQFSAHAPFAPDVKDFGADPEKALKQAKHAYKYSDGAKEAFEEFMVPYWSMSTDKAIKQAAEGAAALISTRHAAIAEKLLEAAAASEDPAEAAVIWTEIIIEGIEVLKEYVAVINLGEYSKAYYFLKKFEDILIYTPGKVKDEPLTVKEDSEFDNTGFPFVSVFYFKKTRRAICDGLDEKSDTKYQDIGGKLMKESVEEHRLSHFATGNFNRNFKNLEPDKFTFEGTIVIPRGRSLKFDGDMTICGDLWVQDGGSLLVNGNLTLKAPTGKEFNKVHGMVRPSGRVFLGKGSTIFVEKDFKCEGSEKFGSVVATSPADKIYTISSGILSNKGDVTIPYGIMPGISIDQLAKISDDLTEQNVKDLKTFMEVSPNIGKIAGAFKVRKDFFAAKAASFIAFRLKRLDSKSKNVEKIMMVPIKLDKDNVMGLQFKSLSQVYSMVFNAYLGEYFYAHADWWPFGEGIVPIIPKMNIENTADEMDKLGEDFTFSMSYLAGYEKRVDKALQTGPETIKSITDTADISVNVYLDFLNSKFQDNCDDKALEDAKSYYDKITKACGTFDGVKSDMSYQYGRMVKASQNFNSYCGVAYDKISENLPGGFSQKSFKAVPGIIVYAGKNLNLGIKEEKPSNSTFPASGLLIAKQDLIINGSFRIVGCLVSLEGDIMGEGTHLRFYPYFTKASLYLPKDFEGNKNTEMITVNDEDLKSGSNPMNIGITMPRLLSEGWDFYSENHYDKNL